MNIPSRFTIERRTAPLSGRRFLGVDNDGRVGWMAHGAPFNHFETRRQARDFRRHRMGADADDAVVVRHSIH